MRKKGQYPALRAFDFDATIPAVERSPNKNAAVHTNFERSGVVTENTWGRRWKRLLQSHRGVALTPKYGVTTSRIDEGAILASGMNDRAAGVSSSARSAELRATLRIAQSERDVRRKKRDRPQRRSGASD